MRAYRACQDGGRPNDASEFTGSLSLCHWYVCHLVMIGRSPSQLRVVQVNKQAACGKLPKLMLPERSVQFVRNKNEQTFEVDLENLIVPELLKTNKQQAAARSFVKLWPPLVIP